MIRRFFGSTVKGTSPSNLFELRINAGNQGQIETSMGIFVDDTGYYTNGNPYNTAQPVSNTIDDNIYQSERAASNFTYSSLTIPNGTYNLRLHFCEPFWTSAGNRVFDVIANGSLILDNYDIFSESGGDFIAIIEENTIVVSNNVIEVQFIASNGDATINGIEFIQIA